MSFNRSTFTKFLEKFKTDKSDKLTLTLIAIVVFIMSSTVSYAENNQQTHGKPVIAVSILPIERVVRSIVGDNFDTVTILPIGSEPENFEIKPKTAMVLESATAVFKLGLPMEKYYSKLQNQSKVYDITKNITYISTNGDDKTKNIHIWLGIAQLKVIAKNIADIASQLDKANANVYQENYNNYITRVDKVDATIRKMIGESNTTRFVSYHTAWKYFAQAYNLTNYNIQLYEEQEPSPKQINHIVAVAKEYNVTTFITEPEFNKKAIKIVADSIDNAKVYQVSPLDKDPIDIIINLAEIVTKLKYSDYENK